MSVLFELVAPRKVIDDAVSQDWSEPVSLLRANAVLLDLVVLELTDVVVTIGLQGSDDEENWVAIGTTFDVSSPGHYARLFQGVSQRFARIEYFVEAIPLPPATPNAVLSAGLGTAAL